MPIIRPAHPNDRDFLLALTARLADFPLPAWRTAAEIASGDHALLLEALKGAGEDSAILVAELEPGDRVGYVFATARRDYFTQRPCAHVEILAVDRRAEGQGVARALMASIEEWARGRGYSWITLNVFAGNTRARGLYEHLGYEQETLHYLKRL